MQFVKVVQMSWHSRMFKSARPCDQILSYVTFLRYVKKKSTEDIFLTQFILYFGFTIK
jgi:hypothetical protein